MKENTAITTTILTQCTLRDYLVANMFDGDDSGALRQNIEVLLDEICENVALWMIGASGAEVQISEYYGEGLLEGLES